MLKKVFSFVLAGLIFAGLFNGMSVQAQDGQEEVKILIPITYLQLLYTNYELFSPYLLEQNGHVAIEELEDGSILWTLTQTHQDELIETMVAALEGIPQLVDFDWLVSIEMSNDITFNVFLDPIVEAYEQLNQEELSDLLYFLMRYGYTLWVYEGVGYEDVNFVVNYYNSETTILVYTENYSVLDLIEVEKYAEITYAADDLERMNLTQMELIAEIEQMDGHLSYEINDNGDVVQKIEARVLTSLFASILSDIEAVLASDEVLSSFVDFQISEDSYEYYLIVDEAVFDEIQEEEYIALFSDFAENMWLYANRTYENNFVTLFFMDATSGEQVKSVLIR